MVNEGHTKRKVLFSRLYGEKATYVVDDEKLKRSHGDHSKIYDVT